MQSKSIVFGAVLAASLMGLGATAQAQQFSITVGPPAPQYEVVPDPRPGYVWAAGHYDWRNGQYVWIPGRWLTAREGYDYRDYRWVQRGNGEWVRVGGNWERRGPWGDRDNDGIANRYDNDHRNRFSPNADLDRDGIANRHDRDIDGDGIPNRRDAFPYNRRRA